MITGSKSMRKETCKLVTMHQMAISTLKSAGSQRPLANGRRILTIGFFQ